jgi:hypothetical protein
MTTTERETITSAEDIAERPLAAYDPRPLRLRRGAALRVLLRPRAAARLLEQLAAEADVNHVAIGVLLRACAQVHYSPSWRPWHG